ncbi:putative MFS transporter [Microthyrium microscopicum]|uniref:Putative MFS transporter n=1 Tax=Microthyrium microscopicum TaxID=703497 RepID=A0A6A6U8U2_9PEZI|nr:putative MFS transporter [Microthyrium microscopicum]
MSSESPLSKPITPKELEKELGGNRSSTTRSASEDNDGSNRHEEIKELNQQKSNGDVDVQPNGGYGWVCVATCFTINAHTWGMNSSYGVFLNYYLSNSVFPSASRLSYAFIGGLSMSMAVLISPIITTVIRKYGTRTCLLIGVFFQTISFIGASFATQIWQLVLSQGICFGFGMGFLFVGSVGIIPQWFSTRRSLANGISASGSGFGGLTYSLATNAMIQHLGLAWTFRVLGILSFVVNTICALLLRDRNQQVGAKNLAFDVKLFRKWEFWILLGFGFFSMLGYVVLLFSIANYASTIGLTPKQASVVGAILNLGQGLGRPPIGYFSDYIGRINMAGTTTFFCGFLVLVVWINAKSYGVLIFYALVGGTVAGTYWATVAPVTAEVVGLKDLNSALSITWLFITLPMLFSEPIGLEIVKFNNGSYLGAQLFAGVMYIAAACCLWILKAWKVGQLERLAASDHLNPTQINPVQEDLDGRGDDTVQVSPFVKRLIKWRKV